MKKWIIKGCKLDCNSVARRLKLEPILVRIMANRGIEEDGMRDFVDKSLTSLYAPRLMKDIDKAVKVLISHSKSSHIRIVGDYDVDGVCATTILYKALRNIDLNISYAIPDRILDGYGINKSIVDKAIKDKVGLLITCDNGIAAGDVIEYAKENGIDVIVTDHHELPLVQEGDSLVPKLPKAEAVVDPSRPDDEYPYKKICGGMVAYKFIERLYEILGVENSIKNELLLFAGISTVCDVMPLLDENRAVVAFAIEELKQSTNYGIKALKEEFCISDDKVSGYTFGFIIGPAINSSGRIAVASLSVELFITESVARATEIAKELKELNVRRQEFTAKGLEQAIEYIEINRLENDKIIVIHLKNVHESVAGIIAGRLKEKYYRPIMVFVDVEEGVKGSGRSIPAYDMFLELSKIKRLFTKLGGHKMAAGFSALAENIKTIRDCLNSNSSLTDDDLIELIEIDENMGFKYINENLLATLERLEPYGNENRKPRFGRRGVRVVDYKLIGKDNNYLRLTLEDEIRKTAIVFNRALDLYELLKTTRIIDIVYTCQLNVWNNKAEVQLLIEDFRGAK